MKACCREYLLGQFGDEEIIAEIYNEYVESAAAKIAECEKCLAECNWEALDRAAHAIKGNALAAGDNDIANAAIELRNASKLQEKNKAAALVASIKEFAKTL